MLFSLPICVIMVLVMDMEELKNRKTPRYQSFDYNSVGVYFITICTQNRRCILSRVVGTGVLDCPSETGVLDCPQIELTQYGEIADKYIKQLNDFYEHLSVEKYVIMPNHIHFLLWVKENKNKTDNGQARTPALCNARGRRLFLFSWCKAQGSRLNAEESFAILRLICRTSPLFTAPS